MIKLGNDNNLVQVIVASSPQRSFTMEVECSGDMEFLEITVPAKYKAKVV